MMMIVLVEEKDLVIYRGHLKHLMVLLGSSASSGRLLSPARSCEDGCIP